MKFGGTGWQWLQLVLLQTLWKSIGNSIQLEAVFKERFQTRKNPRKASLGIKRIFYNLISISLKTGICNADIRCLVFIRSENPLDQGHRASIPPFNQNPLTCLNLF